LVAALIWYGDGWDGFSTLGHDGSDYGGDTDVLPAGSPNA
jgi:hypothetical protein